MYIVYYNICYFIIHTSLYCITLYYIRKHGESFTNLLRNVRKHRNTVLVVRDIEGHIFGGFSTAVWSNHAAFQGLYFYINLPFF